MSLPILTCDYPRNNVPRPSAGFTRDPGGVRHLPGPAVRMSSGRVWDPEVKALADHVYRKRSGLVVDNYEVTDDAGDG